MKLRKYETKIKITDEYYKKKHFDGQQQFFDQALSKYNSIEAAQPGIVEQFKKHIHDIETQYHPSTAGQFQQLWPELAESIK